MILTVISPDIETDALLALMRNTANRAREVACVSDAVSDCVQLIFDWVLHLPEEAGIVALVALVNPAERESQSGFRVPTIASLSFRHAPCLPTSEFLTFRRGVVRFQSALPRSRR